MNLFNEIKVVPPTTYAQIDTVIGQLNEKRDYYLNLRAKEMENALAGQNEEQNAEETEEKEETQDDKTRDNKPARQQKVVDLKEEDFPEL